ncbi:MAG: hypothetical protein U0L53_08385 [Bacteroidales bacterium]|nr:hypothetical protein [Bacteroidales bacterium]
MSKICRIFLLIFSFFVFVGCSNEKEDKLKSKFSEELEVTKQYKRGKSSRAVAQQYVEMEQNLNNRFVNELKELIDNSFEKKLEKFEDEELGFFSNIGYMFDYIFKDEAKWQEELRLKSNKYFNNLDVEQEVALLYKNHVNEINKLRSSFYQSKRTVNMPKDIDLDLPKENVDLNNMKSHTMNNMVIAFGEGVFSWILAFIIGFVIAFILALFGVFVEQDGCLVKCIGLVAVIICFIGMMIVSIRNDNKVLDSFREQQTEITLDYESILNDLDKNTIKFYEKYK